MNRPYAIAVVGMGGVFPSAPDVDAFWNNILAGHDASRPVPAERWPADPCWFLERGSGPDGVVSLSACLIDEIPQPRSVAPSVPLDDLCRLSLVAAEMALDDAQGAPLDRSRVATILASIALPTAESSQLSEEILSQALADSLSPSPKLDQLPSCDPNWRQVTGRPAQMIARHLGLGGPTLTLDAACASSLYSVKLACDALTDGRADAVLAGGVNRADSLYTQAGFTALGALSPSGRCCPFDHKGDGLVVGEGAGILLLKRLEDASAQGDRVYAVIRGIGLSNDVGGSLLAPDSEGQLRALREAYAQAQWAPDDVTLVECHGTGTPMGDKTEFHSLQAFWPARAENSPATTVLGSVKSQVGHLLTGAGAAGLIKVIKAIQHRTLPPMNNFERPSKGVDLETTPFRILSRPEPWSNGRPLRAGVSAFGFGGINGHVLLEEPGLEASQGPLEAPPLEDVVVTAVGLNLGQEHDLERLFLDRMLGLSAVGPRPAARWSGQLGSEFAPLDDVLGTYLDKLRIEAGEFRVPPNDLPEILLQQTLMLAAAHAATAMSSLGPKERCRRSGALIGLNLDPETTNYHLRWALPRMLQKLRVTSDELSEADLQKLRDTLSRPLDSTRTLGALGSIVASRAAREFALGGPSYAISCGDLSGVRALEIAVRAIAHGDMDSCLVGAVDLAGDPRAVWAENRLAPYIHDSLAQPFSQQGGGSTVAEGAVALVLKSRTAAVADGDRILAVIESVHAAGGQNGLETVLGSLRGSEQTSELGYLDVMTRAQRDDDEAFLGLWSEFSGASQKNSQRPTAIGSVAGSVGHAGAVSGLLSVLSAALALDSKILPGLVGTQRPLTAPAGSYLPREAAFWWHDFARGPRRAASVGTTLEGESFAVVMREGDSEGGLPTRLERHRALPAQLFLLPLSKLTRLRAEAAQSRDFAALAQSWYWEMKAISDPGPKAAVVARDVAELHKALELVEKNARGQARDLDGQAGGFFVQDAIAGETAWVFPGSGNHYLGMGRELAVLFPEVAAQVCAEAQTSYQHFTPWLTQPFASSREGEGWEAEALAAITEDPLAPIFSQVTFAILASRVLGLFLPQPQAAIGYSLGETAALFSMGAWRERDEMFERTVASPLFQHQLRGFYETPRTVLGIDAKETFDWRVAVVNRPQSSVLEALANLVCEDAFLLIVNTPNECVVGGRGAAITLLTEFLGCESFFLEGVPAVHCSLMHPVAESYRELHRLSTTPPEGVRFYNGHRRQAYRPDSESAALSITENAQYGFHFPELIRTAHHDGVRHFIEIGPGNSCARMIGSILEGEPGAWSRSLSQPKLAGEGLGFLRLLASAYVHGLDVSLQSLYGFEDGSVPLGRPRAKIEVVAGSTLPRPLTDPAIRRPGPTSPVISEQPRPPQVPLPRRERSPAPAPVPRPLPKVAVGTQGGSQRALVWLAPQRIASRTLTKDGQPMAPHTPSEHLTPVIGLHPDFAGDPSAHLAASIVESTRQTALAHESYLALMEQTRRQMERLLSGLAGSSHSALPVDQTGEFFPTAGHIPASAPSEFAEQIEADHGPWIRLDPNSPNPVMRGERPPHPHARFNRDMCMEFAIGSIANVLGPKFASVDQRSVRVRLPDEPLMLCDRIIEVEGEPGSMTGGRLVSEHDVFPESWYLDHDRAPVCIAVEAGQADLFLCSYLGIDLVTNPDRAYRLLDATITFHRGLPEPGETVSYDIRLDRFVQQGEVYLFFFEYDGTINGKPFITMRKGCAGFHTAEEIKASGGIALSKLDRLPVVGKAPVGWQPPAPFPQGLSTVESYSDAQVQAFRDRDLVGCFGPHFGGLPLQRPYGLPQGRMKLFDRVTRLEPQGGRYGLGRIEAEADIHPDDWFLTCHFTDDMVMPGTLMYECCAHSLRFLLARFGWLAEESEVAFEPRPGIPAVLKCRGPVTVETKKVLYQVDIKEVGFGPEPYVLADALMSGDGRPIVRFVDMSMRLTGQTESNIRRLWSGQSAELAIPPTPAVEALYDKESIMQFSNGKPSLAFGPEYTVFDSERRIARLPGPPFQFVDRVVEVNQPKFVLKAGDWIEAHYDVPPDEWYFAANRQDSMAYCILLEAALQPCGWLAAYVGSALRSKTDVKFRNLGGTATLHKELFPSIGTIRMRVKMTEVSEAGGMIIENFAMEVYSGDELIYQGTTYFGFFSAAALANQLGVRDAAERTYLPTPAELNSAGPVKLAVCHPLSPDDGALEPGPAASMPAKALLMMDQVDLFLPHQGGTKGLGYIAGSKMVDPDEWFFKAHFYQDPVWPGSLGLEAFLQLIKYAALQYWPQYADSHRFEPIAVGLPHTWAYRGQVVPSNQKVVVDISITTRQDGETPLLLGHGFLRVDGIPIYEMTDFGLRLVPI